MAGAPWRWTAPAPTAEADARRSVNSRPSRRRRGRESAAAVAAAVECSRLSANWTAAAMLALAARSAREPLQSQERRAARALTARV